MIEQERYAGDGRSRTVRSYVRRAGRLTPSQRRALERYWAKYGIDRGAAQLLDAARLFGRRAPCVLEIGFGSGDTLLSAAGAQPERNFLGIEVHEPGLGRLLAGLEREGLNNVRVLREDAAELLANGIPAASLAEVWLYFPDPWPKLRHHKRRLIQAPFVERVHAALQSGGRFCLATDWEPYAQQMLQVLDACTGLHNIAGVGRYLERPPERGLTRFERRGERRGHRVRDLIYERID